MNSFNRFHKGTCVLLDLLFVKHTKKKKMEKKKKNKLDIYETSYQLFPTPTPLQADNLSLSIRAWSS